ncbi:MAG: ABC transporter permease subunit [Armatimonadota bacterium]
MPDLLLFKQALRDVLRPKRLLAAAPLVLLPAILGLIWRFAAGANDFQAPAAYNTLSGTLIFNFILVVLAVLFGTGVVASEIEGRTIVYLLTRPVARARVLFSRFAGAVVGITVAILAGTLLLALATFGPSQLFAEAVRRDLLVLPLGALAYGSLFLLVATALPRPLLWGLFFAFGWETWVPLIPGSFKYLSLMTYLRTLAPHPMPEGANADGDLVDLLQMLSPTTITQGTAWTVLAGVIVVCLALALLVFSRKEYAPREDAE